MALQVREAELRLKDLELQASLSGKKSPPTLTATQATIIVAAIGFIGSFIGTYVQAWKAQELKRLEFESNLVIKAVETGNGDVSRQNLAFLLAAGFIKDETGKITKLVANPAYSIQLPARMAEPLRKAVEGSDYQTVIREILGAVGMPSNFSVQLTGDVSSAAALVKDGHRTILLNPQWLAGLRTSAGTDFASIFVLAHEIGHHVLGHTLAGPTDFTATKQFELDADRFAGGVVRRLGGTLQDIRRSLASVNAEATPTSPSRSERLAAAQGGWTQVVTTPPKQ